MDKIFSTMGLVYLSLNDFYDLAIARFFYGFFLFNLHQNQCVIMFSVKQH